MAVPPCTGGFACGEDYTIVLGTLSQTATAQISLDVEPVDNSAELTGYVTQDIEVITSTDWTAAEIIIELTAGSIYQDSAGSASQPNPNLFYFIPSLEFDTYVVGSPQGAAGDIGGDTYQFDDEELDVTWSNMTTDDVGTTTIGRFTLSDDAEGTWTIAATQKGEDPMVTFSGTITDGVIEE